jgi:hypothetical protein
MRAALFKAPRSIEVGDRPDSSISEPTDGPEPDAITLEAFGNEIPET